MRFDTDGHGLSTDIPSPERVCFRPTGNGEWVLGLQDVSLYGDEGDAERFIRQAIFDAVGNDRSDWVRVALRDALRHHGQPALTTVPDPIVAHAVPGGVA